MSGFYTPDGRFLATENGRPVVGAKLYVYLAGTTTPATSYKDPALTVPNTSPVIMDAQGRGVVVLDPAHSYDFELQRADGSLISSQSNIVVPASSSALSAVSAALSAEATARVADDSAENAARVAADASLQSQITGLAVFAAYDLTGSMNSVNGTTPAAIYKSGTISPSLAGYNGTTGEITIADTGWYTFEGYLQFTIVANEGSSWVTIQINGSDYREVALARNENSAGGASITVRQTFSVSLGLTAGAVVKFVASQQGSSGPTQTKGLWLHMSREH